MSDAPQGHIYDLGYKRYVGSKSSVGRRWLVIMRHQMASMWRGFWRFKVWLLVSFLMTAISAGVLYFLSGQMFHVMAGLGGRTLQFADGILPLSAVWYCKAGFGVSLATAAVVVAGDMQTGAFTFYFARSTRPHDYLLGKLAGLCLMMWLIMGLGPFVLAVIRLALSSSTDELIAALPLLPKTLAYGMFGTLIYAAVPLGFSALVPNRRYAMAAWAGYYILVGSMAGGIAIAGKPWVGAIDLPTSLRSIAFWLYDVELARPNGIGGMQNLIALPITPALISVGAHVAAAVGIVLWRIRNAQHTGVGGAT